MAGVERCGGGVLVGPEAQWAGVSGGAYGVGGVCQRHYARRGGAGDRDAAVGEWDGGAGREEGECA